MLILGRKEGERIIVTTASGDEIIVTVMQGYRGAQVRIGVSAPPSVTVDREEVHLRKLAERQQ